MNPRSNCENCLNWQSENGMVCALTGNKVSPSFFCNWHNWNPDEPKEVPEDFEIGIDQSLEEIEDLDGDDDETWAATVPYLGR